MVKQTRPRRSTISQRPRGESTVEVNYCALAFMRWVFVLPRGGLVAVRGSFTRLWRKKCGW